MSAKHRSNFDPNDEKTTVGTTFDLGDSSEDQFDSKTVVQIAPPALEISPNLATPAPSTRTEPKKTATMPPPPPPPLIPSIAPIAAGLTNSRVALSEHKSEKKKIARPPLSEKLSEKLDILAKYKKDFMVGATVLLLAFCLKVYLEAKGPNAPFTKVEKSIESKTEMSSVAAPDTPTSEIASEFEQLFVKAELENGSRNK